MENLKNHCAYKYVYVYIHFVLNNIVKNSKSANEEMLAVLQRTLKNYALSKKIQSALNLGSCQRTLKKIFFFKVR